MSRLQDAAGIAAIVVDGHSDRMGEDAAAGVDQPVRRTFVDRLREPGAPEDLRHRGPGLVADRPRRDARPDARQDGVAIVEHELEQLPLLWTVLSIDRPDSG